ncbi:sigma 54-interacting transcriptional regulator [Sphingorhabdus sp. Alg231-15]|uniref:sigma 54-interacting transcriptional regulator n=1 Tax=Sphingorhabdus sp. Alg231-15 TaxID=1922222 RepID=UPI000D55A6E8
MINNTIKSSLVSRFPELVDMLGSVESFHSDHTLSSAAAQLPHIDGAAHAGANGGAKDPVVIYRDGPFRFVPATLSQPPRIEFGKADKEFGLSCIIEAMRGGKGPAFADPKSIALYKYAARVARSDANVMITGETGTGKEGVARYIHEHSTRADKQLVTVNCAAITETMIESILFGHKKGAFTGAYANAVGLFKEADGGTIFLDEITEMPLESQSKLLRVLQEGEILPVGSTRHEKIDVRIICAANRNFAEEVKAGKFREDLYWRLNVMPVELEPLAARPADIAAISAFMMMDFQKGHEKFVSLSKNCVERLKAHHWPGNVRELANVLQRALVMCDGDCIGAGDLMFSGESLSAQPKQDAVQPGSSARFVRGRDLHSISKSVEYDAINKTLEQTNGNRREAAKELGISERTLRYRMADMRALAA